MTVRPSIRLAAPATPIDQDASTELASQLTFTCPACGEPLTLVDETTLICTLDCESFRSIDGIWRFLLPERRELFQPFLDDYEAIRRAEGRGSSDAGYYRSLPWQQRDDQFANDWKIRARSFETLIVRVLEPLERGRSSPLKIADLGAGNCWLSNRLAERGHDVAAVDLLDNVFDGLGCYTHYETRFTPVQAEFDRLPFASDQFDLVVFNGSFHYATDYETTLDEALRVLEEGGQVVVIDSPLYRDPNSGHEMVREREREFERRYGFPSNQLPSEGFLTWRRLRELSLNLDIEWDLQPVWYGWRWSLRPWKARLLGRREPATFSLIAGRKQRQGSITGSGESILTRGSRQAVRLGLSARYRLTQSHRHRNVALEHVAGRPILVLPDVFNPVLFRSGVFLAESLDEHLVPPGASVLDLGTGTGAGAIAAAEWAGHVVTVDINLEAVRCARINRDINGLENRVDVRHGDLFEPVQGERFDVILFNPPYYRGEPADDYDHAWRSIDVVERFARELSGHLTDGGYALVVLSTDGDAIHFLDSFRANELRVEIAAEQKLVNETLTIYRFRPKL